MKKNKIYSALILILLSVISLSVISFTNNIVIVEAKTKVSEKEMYILDLYKESRVIVEDDTYLKDSVNSLKEAFKILPQSYIDLFIDGDYVIEFVEEIPSREDNAGLIDYANHIIYINCQYSVDVMKEVIIHEMSHYFDRYVGLKLYKYFSLSSRKELTKLYNDYKDLDIYDSHYKKNQREFFAKIMTDYIIQNDEDTPKEITKYIKDILKKANKI